MHHAPLRPEYFPSKLHLTHTAILQFYILHPLLTLQTHTNTQKQAHFPLLKFTSEVEAKVGESSAQYTVHYVWSTLN